MMNIFKAKIVITLLLLNLQGSVFAQQWEKGAIMPIPVVEASAIVLNDTIYIIGGLQGKDQTLSALIQTYYPPDDKWGVLAEMNYGRVFPLLSTHENKLVILGGSEDPNGQTTLEVVDPNNPEPLVSAQDPSFYRLGASAATANGWLYMLGGYQGNPLHASSLHFISGLDFSTFKVSTLDSTFFNGFLPFEHCSVALNGSVYMFGGIVNTISNKVLRLDPGTRSLEQMPTLLTARAAGAAVSDLDENIYILGGYNQQQPALNSIEQYRIGDNSVTGWGLAPMHYARRAPCAVYYNDKIYVFGGMDEYGRLVETTEIFIQHATPVEKEPMMPHEFELNQNYPNPFNLSTTISFALPRRTLVKLEIFAADGRLISTPYQGTLGEGHHRIDWHGIDSKGNPVPSGVYFYKLSALEWTRTLKCLLIK